MVKHTKEYSDMLKLKDEVELELTRMQEEQVENQNILGGLHRGK